MGVHVGVYSFEDLHEAILLMEELGESGAMTVGGLLISSAEQHTKLRFRWNELNFLVRKYLGSTVEANSVTLKIRNALPESDQAITC